MPNLDPLDSVTASTLVSASIIAALIPSLVNHGVLSPQDVNEIYENALLMIETRQAMIPPYDLFTRPRGNCSRRICGLNKKPGQMTRRVSLGKPDARFWLYGWHLPI
jgi:hypothetical protein